MDKVALKSLIALTKDFRLLLVEDDEESRQVLHRLLGTFFHNIELCSNGEEAWKIYQQGIIDIVITDISMPKMSGLELIANIRQKNKSLPILILSAFNEPEYFIQSIEYGIDGYLLKPFNYEQFYTILSKVITRIENEKRVQLYSENLEKMLKSKTQEMEHHYLHDYHTGVANAIMLEQDMDATTYNYMLLLDISHFGAVSKEYGKEFARAVLIKIAKVLKQHIHKNAKLYKIESDRFVILLKESSQEEAAAYCKQLISFFDTKNIEIGEVELHISFNIGVDRVREDSSETHINCEYALDKSKVLGSRHFELFSEDIARFENEKEAIYWLRLTRELVVGEYIEPYFQPIQDTKTGKIEKYEVLARGIYEGETIAPIFFMAPAEKLGLSTAITRLIINKSFAFFRDKEEKFTINLTKRDLLEGYLFNYLEQKLKQYNIEPSRVIFEVVERITIARDAKESAQELNKLRLMGFEVAVDDFGVENANFSNLLEIHLDYIKIDGIFIRGLSQSSKNQIITKAIVNLAKTLGIKTIAEYVEDEKSYEIVKECGIDFAQGYYIGKPKPRLLP